MRLLLAAVIRTAYVGVWFVTMQLINYFRWTPEERGTYIWNAAREHWAKWLLRLFNVEVRVVGKERVNWRRAHVVLANHTSTFDIFALVTEVPGGRFVARLGILLIFPLVGACAFLGEQIIVVRKGFKAQAMGAVRRGLARWQRCNLIFFPEGTRSVGLGPFKRGGAGTAVEHKLPLVLVAISGADFLERGFLATIRFARASVRRATPLVIKVEFLCEISVDSMTRSDVPTLTEFARRTIGYALSERQ